MELLQRLRGLGVEVNVVREVQPLCVLGVLYDNGSALRLPYQSEHLGVSFLSEDDDVRLTVNVFFDFLITFLYALLQGEHHGTGSVDDVDVVLSCLLVRGRWFAVGTEQHGSIAQLCKLVVVDGLESHVAQSFALHSVVYYVSEAI